MRGSGRFLLAVGAAGSLIGLVAGAATATTGRPS